MAGFAPLAARKSKAAPEKKRPAPAKPKGQHEQDRSIALHPPPLSIRSGRPPPAALLKEESIQAKLTVSEPDDELEKEADQVADKVMMRMLAASAPMGDDDDERIQTKLTVSEPNDPFEREADRVADEVMRMPDPTASAPVTAMSAGPTESDDTELQRAEDEDVEEETTAPMVQRTAMFAPIQRACASCSAEPTDDDAETKVVQRACSKCDDEMNVVQRMCETCSSEEEKEHVQTKRADEENGSAADPEPSFSDRLREARSAGGSPLPRGVRQFMEPRFRQDFSSVRIHTDARADSLNRGVSARAFTTGHDIFFRPGEFRPSSVEGRRLIAHELTHVVQQGSEQTAGHDSSALRIRDTIQRKRRPVNRPPPRRVLEENIKIRDAARRSLEEEAQRFEKHELRREQKGRGTFLLEIYRLMQAAGLTGTVGPASNPGQAIGGLPEQISAVIGSKSKDEISQAIDRRAAVEEFFRTAAAELPHASFTLFGAMDPNAEFFDVVFISTDSAFTQKFAREHGLLFRRLDKLSADFEEMRPFADPREPQLQVPGGQEVLSRMALDRSRHAPARDLTPGFLRRLDEARAAGGSPLPSGIRRFMEPRLGRDLGDVRVHTGEQAFGLNRGIDARAFTIGSDVFFNRGEMKPGTAEGNRLIAHELAHVVQQQVGTHGALQRQISTESEEPMSTAETETTELLESVESNASIPLEEVSLEEIAESAEIEPAATEAKAPEVSLVEESSESAPAVPPEQVRSELDAQPEEPLELDSVDSTLEEAEADLAASEAFGEQAEQTVSEEPVPEGPIESIESEAMIKLRDQVVSQKAAVLVDATTTKARIEATAASEKDRVAAALTAERAGLATMVAEQRTQLATAANAARAAILAARDAEIEKTKQAADTEAGRLEQAIETKVSELSQNAEQKAKEGVDFAERQALRAETQTQANVAQTRAVAASVIKAFATSDRAARIQRVINENAGAAAAQLLKMGGMLVEKVRFDGRAFADKIRSDAEATGRTFREEVKPAALGKINAERDKTIEGLNRMAETPLEQLAGLEEDLAARLESSQEDVVALLARLIAIASADIDTAATAAVAAVNVQTGLTLTELDSFVMEAESLLAGEPPEVADPVFAELSSSANEAVNGYHVELGRFATQAQEGIAERADTVTNQSAERQGGDGSGLGQIGAVIEAKLAELAGNVATDMAGLTAAGTENMAAVTTRTEQELASIVQKKNTIWQDELNKDSASIARTVDQGLKDQRDVLGPLHAELTAEAKKIDEESILMRILKTVGGFIVGVFSVAWELFVGLVKLVIILAIAVVLVVGALVLIGLGGVFAVIGGIILAATLLAALAFVVLAVASLVIGLVDGVTKFWDNVTDSSLDDFDRSKGATEGGLDALLSAAGIITLVGGLLRGGLSAARKLKLRLRFRARTRAPRTLTPGETAKELAEAEKAAAKANEAAERAARGAESRKPGEAPAKPKEPEPVKPKLVRHPTSEELQHLSNHRFTYDPKTGIATRADGATASLNAEGRWALFRENGELVAVEHSIQLHKNAPKGAGGFFNSHHPVQDEWALRRLADKNALPDTALHDPKLRYRSGDEPSILLRDKFGGSPHQNITGQQAGRKSSVGSRNYADERKFVKDELKQQAKVPDATRTDVLNRVNAYFKTLHDNIKDPVLREAIFGDYFAPKGPGKP